MAALLQVSGTGAALVLHALAVPAIFAGIARHYFRARGARAPLPTAIAWSIVVALLDLAVVAALVRGSFALFGSIWGTWLPLGLIFLVTWATGSLMATLPWPKPGDREQHPAQA